jgi:hypothetical protein
MSDDRLPLRTLLGRIAARIPWGRPLETWIECARDDLQYLSELHGMKGIYINWRSLCKDRKAWTDAIDKVVEMHT